METSLQDQTERVLEKIRSMDLPEDEKVFSLDVDGKDNSWHVSGIVGPFAHTIQPGCPYPTSYPLHLSELAFSSEEEAIDFAKKVRDILVERGKRPIGPTCRLLEGRSH